MHLLALLAEGIFIFIDKHGYAALLAVLAIEEAGVPLPIPGDLLLTFAGYKVLTGKMEFWKVIFTTVLATTAGSSFLYAVFKYGGRPLAQKYGKYILLSDDKLEALEKWFDEKGKWAVILGRFLPYARVFVSAVAGLSGLKYIYFLPQAAIASLLWALGFTYLGLVMGNRWKAFFEGPKTVSLIFLAIFIVLIAVFIIKEKRKSKPKFQTSKDAKIY